MQIRLSAHGAYHHQFHVVWIPKYRKKILKGELRKFIEKRLFDVQDYHPDVEIEKYSIKQDHIHLIIIIPPKYAVSDIIGKIKANTSREIRKRFSWVKKIYWRNEFWSPGFFLPPQSVLMKTSSKDMWSFKRKLIKVNCN